MTLRDQHLKSCKNKAIKFVKSGEIDEAISFLEKEMNFFKQTKNHDALNKLTLWKKEGAKSKDDLIELIKSIS